jgi:hypothetical protein
LLPPRGESPDPDKLFQDRFGRLNELQRLNKRLQKLANKDVQDFVKELAKHKIDPNNRDFQRQVEEYLKQLGSKPEDGLSGAEWESLRRWLKEFAPRGVSPSDPPKTPPNTGTGNTGTPNKTPEPTPQPPQSPEDLARAQQQMARLAENLRGLSGRMDESPA